MAPAPEKMQQLPDLRQFLGDRWEAGVCARGSAAGRGQPTRQQDDRRNYEMFHAEGVPCIYIHSGYYD